MIERSRRGNKSPSTPPETTPDVPPDSPSPPPGNNGTPPPTVEAILAAIRQLPEATRRSLIRTAMQELPEPSRLLLFEGLDDADAAWLLDYVMTAGRLLRAYQELVKVSIAQGRLTMLVNRALREAQEALDRRHRQRENAERDAEVVKLHDEEKLTFKQIGRRLDITERNARQIYRRSQPRPGA